MGLQEARIRSIPLELQEGSVTISREPRVKPPFAARIARPEDIAAISEDVSAVRLMHQRVFNLTIVAQLLDTHPLLQTVEMGRSLHARLVGPRMRELLEEHGIRVEVKRVRDVPVYDRVVEDASYVKKKEAYQKVLEEPEKATTLAFMKAHAKKFPEALIMEMYLSRRIAIREIAAILGLEQRNVQRKLTTILYWMGVASKDRLVHASARKLERRIKKVKDRVK